MRQEMMGFGDAVASAGPYANNFDFAADRYHNNTPSLNFYRLDALPDAQPTVRALAALLFCIIVYWQFTAESCCKRTFITGLHFVELWAKV